MMYKDMIHDNMSDKEIRILGTGMNPPAKTNMQKNDETPPDKVKWKKRFGCLFIFLILLVIALCAIFISRTFMSAPKADASDTLYCMNESMSFEKTIDNVESLNAFVLSADTTINDIPLRVITPTGGKMSLYMGKLPKKDKNIILAVQAADMRSDIDAPTGAFVYNGELISKGHSKYGFCAIIGDEITIGRQTETPLFERAIEKDGCFFRQYSLVSKHRLMDIPPKGKSIRRALCVIENKFCIIETTDKESYHDFSQALIDYGVEDALAMVGGEGLIMWRENGTKSIVEGLPFADSMASENYLIWKK